MNRKYFCSLLSHHLSCNVSYECVNVVIVIIRTNYDLSLPAFQPPRLQDTRDTELTLSLGS